MDLLCHGLHSQVDEELGGRLFLEHKHAASSTDRANDTQQRNLEGLLRDNGQRAANIHRSRSTAALECGACVASLSHPAEDRV